MLDCFIIMPINPSFDRLFGTVVAALRARQLAYERADEITQTGIIFDQIVKRIGQAKFCIADLTGNNPNVNAEVGIAIAMGKPVILLTRDEFSNIPFDLRHYRVFGYKDSDAGYADLQKCS